MMMQSAWQLAFGFFDKLVVVEPAESYATSDAGLLPIREFDAQIGLTERFIAALNDPRHQPFVEHTFAEMARMRIYGILADYPDQNDHDVLGRDPLFKLLAGRSPDAGPLASQPTLSRFENSIDIPSLRRLEDALIEQFIQSFWEPPRQLTFDIDTFDDSTYGQQQLTFWHDYYQQYQYLPRVITCAENDLVVILALLYGSAHPALGLPDDLRKLVGRLREVWPDVHIQIRADSGFGVPAVFDVCEELRVDYSIGLRLNPVLKRESEALLQEVLERYRQTGQPQCDACGFSYRAGSWDHARWCLVKAETTGEGNHRRAVLTNRPGAPSCPWRPTRTSPGGAKAKTATKNSRAGCRPTASATIATWPICSGFTCILPR